jgi:hypothetical protein
MMKLVPGKCLDERDGRSHTRRVAQFPQETFLDVNSGLMRDLLFSLGGH